MQRRGFLATLTALVVGPRLPRLPAVRGSYAPPLPLTAEGARREIQAAIGVAAAIRLKNLGPIGDDMADLVLRSPRR
jgi:hypothetical protein